MKNKLFTIYAFVAFISNQATAQMVSTDIFLKGNYIETAIAQNGCLGSGNNAPAGYHALLSGKTPAKLAIVADPARDGFSTGSPAFFGDYIMSGTMDEQWTLQVNGDAHIVSRSFGDTYMPVSVTGSTYDYKSFGDFRFAYWSGTIGAINIFQTTAIDVKRMGIIFSVKLVNTGSATLNNVYYKRSVDPDNEVEQFPSKNGYKTHLKIENQSISLMQKVGVSATGDSMRTYLGMHTKDCRAKAFYTNSGGTASPLNDLYYNVGTASPPNVNQSVSDSLYADAVMGLVFQIGNLLPGDSAAFDFFYALDKKEVDSIYSTIYAEPSWVKDSVFTYQIGNNDTVFACDSELINMTIIARGSEKWDWDTSSLLSTTKGISNTIIATGTHTYKAIRYDTSCKGNDTIRLTIVGFKVVKPVVTYIKSGSSDFLSAGPGTYMSYLWYRNGVKMSLATTKMIGPLILPGCYQVEVLDSTGCYSMSDTNCLTLSLKELTLKDQITIYPNPTNGKISINSPVDLKLELKEISGRILIRSHSAKEIDLTPFADGLYLLQLYNKEDELIDTRKIIKQ